MRLCCVSVTRAGQRGHGGHEATTTSPRWQLLSSSGCGAQRGPAAPWDTWGLCGMAEPPFVRPTMGRKRLPCSIFPPRLQPTVQSVLWVVASTFQGQLQISLVVQLFSLHNSQGANRAGVWDTFRTLFIHLEVFNSGIFFLSYIFQFLKIIILELNIFFFFLADETQKVMISGDHLLGFQIFHLIPQNTAYSLNFVNNE